MYLFDVIESCLGFLKARDTRNSLCFAINCNWSKAFVSSIVSTIFVYRTDPRCLKLLGTLPSWRLPAVAFFSSPNPIPREARDFSSNRNLFAHDDDALFSTRDSVRSSPVAQRSRKGRKKETACNVYTTPAADRVLYHLTHQPTPLLHSHDPFIATHRSTEPVAPSSSQKVCRGPVFPFSPSLPPALEAHAARFFTASAKKFPLQPRARAMANWLAGFGKERRGELSRKFMELAAPQLLRSRLTCAALLHRSLLECANRSERSHKAYRVRYFACLSTRLQANLSIWAKH